MGSLIEELKVRLGRGGPRVSGSASLRPQKAGGATAWFPGSYAGKARDG
jgi:hypothetical protein